MSLEPGIDDSPQPSATARKAKGPMKAAEPEKFTADHRATWAQALLPTSTMAGKIDPLLPTGRPIRWGVVSTGRISSIVARDLSLLPDAVLHSVSSRTQKAAETFAAHYGFSRAYGDDKTTLGYERLVQDPEVDVVYVATPHSSHYVVAKAALKAGKHVLCEKPLTINSKEAAELVDIARARQVFFMEAIWSRFLPSVQRAAEIIATNELGDIRWMQADMGGRAPYSPAARVWRLPDGGGSLMDVAVYPLTWALLALGPPETVKATADLNFEGIDAQTALTLSYSSGASAQIITTLTSVTTRTVTIAGTLGVLRSNAPLLNPTELIITSDTGHSRTEKFAPAGQGYTYQLREVLRCIQQGLLESPTMPLSDTLSMMQLLDDIRGQIGLRYPAD